MKTQKQLIDDLKNIIWHLKINFETDDIEYLKIKNVTWKNRLKWQHYDLNVEALYQKIITYQKILDIYDEELEKMFKWIMS